MPTQLYQKVKFNYITLEKLRTRITIPFDECIGNDGFTFHNQMYSVAHSRDGRHIHGFYVNYQSEFLR